jgi:hypothetical protein
MERTTHEFTTPQGQKLVLKDYLTAREVNSVLSDLFKTQEVSTDQEGKAAPHVSLLIGIQRNIKLIEAAVVSLEGSSENLAERLQDLPASEYTAILNEVKALADGNF